MQKYEVLDRIGEGAYGIVLKCRYNEAHSQKTKTIYDQSEHNIVAMKQFKDADDNEIVRKTTMREVKVLKMLDHPNIVHLKEAFRKKGIVYLIFEYLPYNLLEVLEKSPQGLDHELVRKLIYQLVKGLAYLHSLNIVHRDIKLENLLIGHENQMKICDFGFAKILKKTKKQDLTDYVATRWYRSPELLVGGYYGKEIDMWAVGCILGELIDGNPMFPGENQLDQLFLIQKCLGRLIPEHSEIFLKNPRYLGTKFPQINTLETVQKRYLGKLSPKGLNFLKQLLKMNPNERLTAVEALEHPYFDGIREEQLMRRHSINYQRNEMPDEMFASGASTNVPDKKKQGQNLYNPPLNSFNTKQKVESSQRELGHGNKNVKLQINKKSVSKKEESMNSTGFTHNGNKSKSLMKGKVNKFNGEKEKNLSVEKYRSKQYKTKTQTGFYLIGGGIIQQKEEQDDQMKIQNNPQSRNTKYKIRSPKSRKQKKGTHINTEQAQEEDGEGVWQSTGQLPFLVMTTNKSMQNKHNKVNINPTNIIMTNNNFNYRHM